MEEITAAYVRRLLPRRDPMGHKGTFGKVLCVCGSVGFSGAAVFAGRAAVRTGSGLVYLVRCLERGKWFRSARNINLPLQTSLQVI